MLARLGRRADTVVAVLVAFGIVALTVHLRVSLAVSPKPPGTLVLPTAGAESADFAPSTPEPGTSPTTVPSMASAASASRPRALAPRGPRSAAPSTAVRAPATTDVVDPWRER
jgi:hypothetical protein